MAEFKPTASQAAAISARGSAVLVSAGAGSGKTRVLTERLMGYITDAEHPVDIDSFLIITFTRAAAGELRGRIMDEIANALAADPANKRLRRQSALCQKAQIGTIHSFCAALLREHCHACGLPPQFKIADDDRIAVMKSSALERVLDRYYENVDAHPGFALLADTVGAGRDDRRLGTLVLTLHDKMQCHARPEQWAAEQVALLGETGDDAAQTPWGREIIGRVKSMADYWAVELERVLHAISAQEKIAAAYTDSIAATADQLRELRRCLDLGWDRARACLPITYPALGRLAKSPDPALSELAKNRRTACKKATEKIGDMLYSDSEKLLSELRLTTPAMTALLALTLDFAGELTKDKRRAGLVDYGDLEHISVRLLTNEDGSPSALARQLGGRFTEIMVDEYQDVSRVQDEIFRAISRDGKNLFMVGDVKQSIYRFRLADPGIFTEKYLSYADCDAAAPGEPRRIMLRENFRSRSEVLDAANAVFGLCMSRELGDIDYDEAAALKCGASYEGEAPKPELRLIELPRSCGDEDSPDKTELEAQYVAARIRELIDVRTEVSGRGGMRPLEYGDIAILLRSANSIGGVYRNALVQQGIPVASVQGGGFFTSIEISTMMSLLAVIDNPYQDIPLIAVLRSPVFGFTADELSAIRASGKRCDFYTALCAAAETDEKCAGFVRTLAGFRAEAPDMSAAELTWRLCGELDMLAICSAMTDGEQRRANLLELVELSERFESSGYRGLHRFVLWLRRLAEKGQEPASGAASASAVQIMSIHKSKGLEFPVVFLCDTARRFNKRDSQDSVLVHPQLGLGPKLTDTKRRIEYPTLARHAIRLRLERETLSEELRLLYVALTRPKERLIVTGVVKDAEKTLAKAREAVTTPMAPEVLASAQSMLDWLIYSAIADGGRHIAMETAEPAAAAPVRAADTPVEGSDEGMIAELERKLSFEYPYADAVHLPSKVTATELKGRDAADEDAQSVAPKPAPSFRTPDFGRVNRPATGTERGVATHLVLQYMDFSKTGSIAEINHEIARLEEEKFITAREAEAVDAEAIDGLFRSPLGRRMLAAKNMRREFKFSLLVGADEVFGAAAGEQVLLQGVVDCCIEEDGELVIIDYKTDRVRGAAVERRAETYAGQLRAYAAAMERITGKPVRECALYFLAAGRTVTVPLKTRKSEENS